MADADFKQAMKDLEKTVDNFDKMSQAEKEKAADQMKQLAQSLQQAPEQPAVGPGPAAGPAGRCSRWA